LEITLEKKNNTEASIKITLKESDYQTKVDEKVKEYSKKASLKGFRPGKVPPGVIKKMYGKSIKVEEINHILSHALTDYIKENDLQVLGDPLPDLEKSKEIDWENQKEFEFKYDIGLADDFNYDLSKIKVTKYDIEVDKKTINETMNNLRRQHGRNIHPDESKEGDYLSGEIEQVDGELKNETIIDISQVKKKEKKKFIGLKKGESIKFEIRKAFDTDAAIGQLLGKPAEEVIKIYGEFNFIVNEINRRVPAEVNQEFFDKVLGEGKVKSEEELNKEIAEHIKQNYQRETEAYLQKSIQEALIEKTKIELPDVFLKDWILRSNQGKVTTEDIEKEYDHYAQDLKWSLIRNKIVKDQDIKVEHAEVLETTKKLILSQLANAGMVQNLQENIKSFAENYLKGEDGQNYMKIHNQVQNEKVLEYVKENVKSKNKKISMDEFQKIVTK